MNFSRVSFSAVSVQLRVDQAERITFSRADCQCIVRGYRFDAVVFFCSSDDNKTLAVTYGYRNGSAGRGCLKFK
ncbi:Protein of unknown function [Gryllus bimaculatus]|nr:Protein of unknown function [Gryllus bimaculatus]